MSKDKPPGPDLRAGIPVSQLSGDAIIAGTVDGEAVVVTRFEGKVCALSGSCTHLGASLAKGAVIDGELRCPWHHARFSIRSGEATAAPAFEPLARYAVREVDGLIKVEDRLPAAEPARPTRVPDGGIVIVGTGAAGHACADLLARRGLGARVLMIGAEADAPYDRTFCSKQYLAGKKSRDDAALPAPGLGVSMVKMVSNARVESIDVLARQLRLDGGERISYSTLVLATGAEPQAPDFEGAEQVHVLRTLADADALIAAAGPARHAAVVGASFIGLEAAASLRTRGLEVTVIAPDDVPLGAKFGDVAGRFVQKLHEDRQVQFRLQRKVQRYDGKVLTLDDGSKVAADLVVAGLGVSPSLKLAKSAGLAIAGKQQGGGVLVDAQLRSSAPDIYAIGDIASYPEARLGQHLRVEHWVHAQRQGQFVARLLMGEAQRYTDTPFFWSGHYDQSLRYVGRGAPDHLEIAGQAEQADFAVQYLAKDGREQALLTCGRDQQSLRQEASWDEEGKRSSTVEPSP